MTNRESHVQTEEAKFFAFLGIDYPYKRPATDFHSNPDPTKILSISDPHSPFENWTVLKTAFDEEHNAGILIVPGDVGDYYSKSRFRKTRVVTFKEEVQSVFRLIEWLATRWTCVKLMIGNHDTRPEKTIAALFEGNTDLLIMTEANLLKYIASYFDNVEVVGTQLDGTDINLTHIYQYGDIIFTHGELSRMQKTATLEYISRYLHRWRDVLELNPFRIVAQAHNHTDMKTTVGTEKWFMLPTASDPYSVGMEYIYSSRMIGTPPSLGYTVFHQFNGVTDYNKSNNFLVNYESH